MCSRPQAGRRRSVAWTFGRSTRRSLLPSCGGFGPLGGLLGSDFSKLISEHSRCGVVDVFGRGEKDQLALTGHRVEAFEGLSGELLVEFFAVAVGEGAG